MDRDLVNELYEEMFMLSEVAGELDPESNRQIDQRIKEIQKQLSEAAYDEVGC